MEPKGEGLIYTRLTAVHPDYRGQGLGLAVKVTALDWAKARGFTQAYTYNHSVNTAMLAINRGLGYQPQAGIQQLYRPL